MPETTVSPDAALEQSLAALNETPVRLTGVRPAHDVLPEVGARRFLHAGPPLSLDEIPGPMRGAVICGLLFEDEAATVEEAEAIIDRGEIELIDGDRASVVGAMAGIVTPSMPVVVAESPDAAAYSPLNEGIGRAMRFGSYDEATLRRLRWMADVAGPTLQAAIDASDAIDLVELIAEGLRRGDECHNRNVATSVFLMARLGPALVRTAPSPDDAAGVMAFAVENRHFALPFSISMAKVLAQAAHRVPNSPIVTALAGNGRRFGIKVSGAGDRWFTCPSVLGDAIFFEGYTADDAMPLMGDSAISETVGFGAFALTSAPAITSFVGGTFAQSRQIVEDMRAICGGTSTRFLLPTEDFRGTPVGIDVRRVAATGIGPWLNNGLAHREPGRGQVGAGITQLPIEPFIEANAYLKETTS